MACLIVLGGKDFKKRFDITADEVVIGRSPEVDIVIDDKTVSRRHAGISKTESGEFSIKDMGSQNKTKVNDAETDAAILKDGDEIRIGAVKLMFADKEDPDVLLAKKMKQAEPLTAGKPRKKSAPRPIVIGLIAFLVLVVLAVLLMKKPASEEELVRSIEQEEVLPVPAYTRQEGVQEQVQAELKKAKKLAAEAAAEKKKAAAERKQAAAERQKAKEERMKAAAELKEFAVDKKKLDAVYQEAVNLYKKGRLREAAAKLSLHIKPEFSRHPAAKLLSTIDDELNVLIRKYYNQGIIYYQMGNVDKAIENMEKAQKLVPHIEHEYYRKVKERLNTYKLQRELRK